MIDEDKHYHVTGACRDHGGNDIQVVKTKEEVFEVLDGVMATFSNLYKGAELVFLGRTADTIDFIMHINGRSHNMLTTWYSCSNPFVVCVAKLAFERNRFEEDMKYFGIVNEDDNSITPEDASRIMLEMDDFFRPKNA